MRTKPGRPPRSTKPSLERIEVRITATERSRWQAAANREEVSLSEWLRAAADLAIARGATR